jgi:hypothetical protein
MIALGDAYGYNLHQFDVLTFAMPPFVASIFPTPVSVVAVPVAKGILIKQRSKLDIPTMTPSRYDNIQSSFTNYIIR